MNWRKAERSLFRPDERRILKGARSEVRPNFHSEILAMARSLILVTIWLNCGLATSVSHAQLFRSNATPAAREPARVGILGGIREARDERLRRELQAATAAARAAVAQRNAAAAPRPNANSAPQRPAGVASNSAQRRDATANPLALNAAENLSATKKAETTSRTANFRGPSGTSTSKNSSGSSLSRATLATPSSVVMPASAAAFVPEPVGSNGLVSDRNGFDGPGVIIRLPKDARSMVNFLVDETDTNSIRPGEQQVFDNKSSYVVRYSRGVTRDGRSFGESRYVLTPGLYVFELTATGWELYRESDAETNRVPPNPLDLAETSLTEQQATELLSPAPATTSELQRPRPIPTPSNEPVVNEPAANEELLPAPKPRSILE
jgi:hypothetical protein